MAEKITKRSVDYSQWYIDIILQAKLADYSPVKGSMVIRPRGFSIWERIRDEFDKRFRESGHENAYFPLLIPMDFMKKEAEHVKGFAPELAVVTHGGGEELEEPLVIRPTSETMIWYMYRNWIQSWRDLPLLYNQWVNVMRWEKRTRLFLRTAEFLWQEGHTAHETKEEAVAETMKMLEIYRATVEEHLCLPVIAGRKSDSEKFAGAIDTYSIEAMMQDKKALQSGTSHFLGQNFAKAFDVRFQTRGGDLDYVWATSWGVSTRLIGAVIMAHSDDRGLVLPPSLANEEIIIIPIFNDSNKSKVLANAEMILDKLKESGKRVKMDMDDQKSPGWKFAEWEMRGVPLRVELGPRDVEAGTAVLVRRDTLEKNTVNIAEIPLKADEMLKAIQANLFLRAKKFRDENICEIKDYNTMKSFFGTAGEESQGIEQIKGGFANALWCGSPECESMLKTDTKATLRCMPIDQQNNISGSCALCGKPAQYRAIFARNY